MHGLILLALVIIAAILTIMGAHNLVYEKDNKQVWGGIFMVIGIFSLFGLFFYSILHYS